MADDDEDRERLLTLLRSQHRFPGEYTFRIVVRPEDRDRILGVVRSALPADDALLDVGERPSRNGGYVALHTKVRVPSPEAVLAVYGALRGIEGVFAVM